MNRSLAAQQRRLAAAVVTEGLVGDLLRRAAPGRGNDLAVYRHAYRARLTEALRGNYPVLHRVLGDAAFASLAEAYLQTQPSRRPSIRWFGDTLTDHLSATPGALPHPSLIDLARMEWSLGVSFDSADDAVLTPSDLLAVPPEAWPRLRFKPRASVALLRLEWAIEPVRQALKADEAGEADAPQPLPHALLVWRQRLETRSRSLPDGEAALLQSCLDGQAFAQLCEQAAALAAAALWRWVEDGLLSQWQAFGDGP